MKENDYYGNYKAFVEDFSRNLDQILKTYCYNNGVVWRRLYDWMHRHYISLKRLYDTYRSAAEDTVSAPVGSPKCIELREVIPE